MNLSKRARRTSLLLLLMVPFVSLAAQRREAADKASQVKTIELKEPDGQILSYRHLSGSTIVYLRGTRVVPQAQIRLKVESKPGFVKLDIGRGAISGLKPAYQLGKDYLTYVLWAVSVDGRAANLGEITFRDDRPVGINVTTTYQSFWVMVTAEPNFAVVDPSPVVVLYSATKSSSGDVSGSKATPITGDRFFSTHYTTYQSGAGAAAVGNAPNELLQARKAVELARSDVQAVDRSGTKDDGHIHESLDQAKAFLDRAEAAYKKNPKDREVIRFAKTTAQSAENARALAAAVNERQQVKGLKTEVATLKEKLTKAQDQESPAPAAVTTSPVDPPKVQRRAPPPEAPAPIVIVQPLVKQPALWFALVGWGLALALLFRRRSM